MFFDFEDYDYYRTQPSSSRAAPPRFRTERPVFVGTQEVQEKDFTQIVIGWRLSSVKEFGTGVSQSLEQKYTSRTTYYDQFLPLILEDARASVVQGIDKHNKTFPVKIKNDVNAPRDPANPWIMNLEGVIPQDQDHSASMNVLVLSHFTDKKCDMVMLVLASENFDRHEIKAKFNLNSRVVNDNPRIFRAGSKWQAVYITSLVSQQRMYEACVAKAMPDCLKRIVNGRVEEVPRCYNADVARFTLELNASQQHAVQRFVATPEGVVLLQGPPGTGKTTTIVQMLAALVSRGQRVLVCAPSNKAVQVLAERFVEKYTEPVILAGIESKVPFTLRPVFLQTWLSDCHSLFSDVAIKSAATKNKKQFLKALDKALTDVDMAETRINIYFSEINAESFTELKECLMALRQKTESFDFSQENALSLFKEQISTCLAQLTQRKDRILSALKAASEDDIEVALLNRSKVIFSTLSVAGRSQMLDTAVEQVDVLIVDEAGQSVEAETLIAFQHMPRKVLLVGDTKQLPATVISELAKQKGFGRSMMERLEQNRVPFLRLDTQYRMHADISEWPSNRYYDGELVTDASVSVHTNAGLAQSIAFYDIHSGKERRPSGTSRQNDEEAEYVVQVIRRLRETDKTSRIGVITFYVAQMNKIQAGLKRETPAVQQKVTVNTVDGFQGDEREIIILSCVCSGGNIGFLDDPRRLNVAITRPKNTLIVLGNARTLEATHSDLKILIADLRRRTRFFTETQLNALLGKTTEAKAAFTKKGKKAAATAAGGASATEEDTDAFISSSTLLNKKVKKSAAISAAASDISILTAAVDSVSIDPKKRPSLAPAASEVTDSTTPKGKTTNQASCKFFTGALGSCRKGNSCKFKHA